MYRAIHKSAVHTIHFEIVRVNVVDACKSLQNVFLCELDDEEFLCTCLEDLSDFVVILITIHYKHLVI